MIHMLMLVYEELRRIKQELRDLRGLKQELRKIKQDMAELRSMNDA